MRFIMVLCCVFTLRPFSKQSVQCFKYTSVSQAASRYRTDHSSKTLSSHPDYTQFRIQKAKSMSRHATHLDSSSTPAAATTANFKQDFVGTRLFIQNIPFSCDWKQLVRIMKN